jgi:nitrilase
VIISDPLVDVEGITYADIDLTECIAPKQYHDILGHYNRFDIFSLQINRTEQSPIRYIGDATEPSGVGASEHETAPAAIPAQ